MDVQSVGIFNYTCKMDDKRYDWKMKGVLNRQVPLMLDK